VTALMARSCSANEVFHMARKACVGAGLAHDRAEDLAEAVTLLQCTGRAGLAALLQLLRRYQQDPDEPALKLRFEGNRLVAGRLRPEAEGVAVIDWLIAGRGQNEPEGEAGVEAEGMAGVEAPVICDGLIMAGLLLVAARSYGGQFRFQAAAGTAPLVIANPSSVSSLPPLDGGLLSYHDDAGEAGDGLLSYHHTAVAQEVWQALGALAHLTYVPASEASRQSGAGAGLVDND